MSYSASESGADYIHPDDVTFFTLDALYSQGHWLLTSLLEYSDDSHVIDDIQAKGFQRFMEALPLVACVDGVYRVKAAQRRTKAGLDYRLADVVRCEDH